MAMVVATAGKHRILSYGDVIRLNGEEIAINKKHYSSDGISIGNGNLMASTTLLEVQDFLSYSSGKDIVVERLGRIPILGRLMRWYLRDLLDFS